MSSASKVAEIVQLKNRLDKAIGSEGNLVNFGQLVLQFLSIMFVFCFFAGHRERLGHSQVARQNFRRSTDPRGSFCEFLCLLFCNQ
jgi:hypothetical protein